MTDRSETTLPPAFATNWRKKLRASNNPATHIKCDDPPDDFGDNDRLARQSDTTEAVAVLREALLSDHLTPYVESRIRIAIGLLEKRA